MKRYKKVAIFTHNYPATSTDRKDAGIFIFDYAQELAKKRLVRIFSPNFEGKKEKFKTVPVTWFSWSGGKEKLGDWQLFSPLSVLRFFQLIYQGRQAALKFIRKEKVDYILAAWTVPSGIVANFIYHKTGTPYAIWCLGSDLNKYIQYPVLRQLMTKALKEADMVYANSYALCKKAKDIAGVNAIFMPAITNLQKIEADKLPVKKNTTNFLFVGRLETVKGPDILIEAVTILVRHKINFILRIAGDGSLEQKLKHKVTARKLEKYVQFLGRQDSRGVATLMNSSDCLIVPSRNESLPLVIIEAARFSLPVVAANVGDCKRLVSDYKIGDYFEKEDYHGLAKKMLKFAKDKRQFKLGSKKGLTRLANEFQQRNAVGIFLSSLNEK